MDQMQERRTDTRLLCADLIELIWCDDSGRERRRVGNLEDISVCGMCIQMEVPIQLGTAIRIAYFDRNLTGIVRYAAYRDRAYFIGIEFEEDSRWSMRDFVPEHLLDPRELVNQVLVRRESSAGPRLIQ